MSAFWSRKNYSEASTEAQDLAKRGLVFMLAEKFTVAQSASTHFVLDTADNDIEFLFWELLNTGEPVYATLKESATSTAYGDALIPRNLHRGFSDTCTASFNSASAVSGGTQIASELFGSQKASGGAQTQRVMTLNQETEYLMSFYNMGNQNSTIHFILGFSQNEPPHAPLIFENI